MTDQSLPGKQWNAVWRSGDPTIATSGGGFVQGKAWKGFNGNFAAAALAGSRVVFLDLTKAGKLRKARTPAALRRFGRIRTVVDGPGSLIYLTTDNGSGNDAILAVRPRR
jgi:glucose/arabinose dehydrogenase